MVELKRYAGLHPFFKAHRTVIQFKLMYKLRKKPYFHNMPCMGPTPEVITTEMWIHLIDLSLQLGHTLILVDHYRWAVRLVESRGVQRQDFVGGFSDVILTTRDIVVKMTQDEKQMAAWTHFFHALREEFVETIRQMETLNPMIEPVKLFGQK